MLVVDSIHTYYGDSHILQGVSLEVNAGELVTILGRNGAGKTTTIRSIIGFNRPRTGRIAVSGKDTTRLQAHQIAQVGVGLVPQGRRIFAPLPVKEHLTFAYNKKGGWSRARI